MQELVTIIIYKKEGKNTNHDSYYDCHQLLNKRSFFLTGKVLNDQQMPLNKRPVRKPATYKTNQTGLC